MDTEYAPAERASALELADQIHAVSQDPVVESLLHAAAGLIAVLNEQRQVVAINDAFLREVGIEDPQAALGLRHGEVLECVNSADEPHGCGTTRFCQTCGAAVAIVASLGEQRPAERSCAIAAQRGDREVDLALSVRSQPLRIQGRRFLLLFLTDITLEVQRAALERAFFHDIGNMINVLVGAAELLELQQPSRLAETIHHASTRLLQEVAIQHQLVNQDEATYKPMWRPITVGQVMAELRSLLSLHPATDGKMLVLAEDHAELAFHSDFSLLSRILCNMVINAMEASELGAEVHVMTEQLDESVVFRVWNGTPIPAEVQHRIFQRNFSTKAERGRGLGTWSMKRFGEGVLGGQVRFASSEGEGTEFSIALPL
jgi:signal transduction histidine kinase